MKLHTNEDNFGGPFWNEVSKGIAESDEVIIASGYISVDIISAFRSNILKLIRRGGKFILIVGMAFFEGLTNRQYTALIDLHNKIQESGGRDSGVKLIWSRRFHGKIYCFKKGSDNKLYVGSSNFSATGLRDNIEANIKLDNAEDQTETLKFLRWLDDKNRSTYINKVEELNITDSQKFKESIIKAKLKSNEAQTYAVSTIDPSRFRYFDISLNRVDKQPKSNLNAYFGKGRWQRGTGNVIPRNWFEVEIIVDQKTTRNPLYPRGDFKIITDDGYTFECRTESKSNHYKNLRSKQDLTILGKWIKMKLQNAGALQPLTPVTSETLTKFGRDYIRLYKMHNATYFVEFSPE